MYTMKSVCDELHIPYETLRYYCNKGLVPNVKRDWNNYWIFDDKDLNWLACLSNKIFSYCGDFNVPIQCPQLHVNVVMTVRTPHSNAFNPPFRSAKKILC